MNIPTLFHITHWKAGSQWIAGILSDLFPAEIIKGEIDQVQVLQAPIQHHKVYTNVYITKRAWDGLSLPEGTKRFLVIRDPRDTLVSAYFSLRYSHPLMSGEMETWRCSLRTKNVHDGMVCLMDEWLPSIIDIQRSWLEGGENFFRFEDLINNDIKCFEDILLTHCRLPIDREVLADVVARNTFSVLSRGRKPGDEDRLSHYRKGAVGDWKIYFTEGVRKEFKKRFNDTLVLAEYEKNDSW